MTRSLGDFAFKTNLLTPFPHSSSTYALSNLPALEKFSLGPKPEQPQDLEMILLGCDGLWDGTDEVGEKELIELGIGIDDHDTSSRRSLVQQTMPKHPNGH